MHCDSMLHSEQFFAFVLSDLYGFALLALVMKVLIKVHGQ